MWVYPLGKRHTRSLVRSFGSVLSRGKLAPMQMLRMLRSGCAGARDAGIRFVPQARNPGQRVSPALW